MIQQALYQLHWPVLTWHKVDTEAKSPWYTTDTFFRQQLSWIKDSKLGAILSFDDGYASFLRVAYPIIKELLPECPILLSVCSSLVGKTNVFDKGVEPEEDLLNWDHINQLSREGVYIASHTRTHPNLTTLSIEQVTAEIILSKVEIEKSIGSRVDYFVYPHNAYNDQLVSIVSSSGYLDAFAGEDATDEQYTLKRYSVGNTFRSDLEKIWN